MKKQGFFNSWQKAIVVGNSTDKNNRKISKEEGKSIAE